MQNKKRERGGFYYKSNEQELKIDFTQMILV
jgi:hypothetical protein